MFVAPALRRHYGIEIARHHSHVKGPPTTNINHAILLRDRCAAYASPIIMMSQNRQAKLDARRAHLDLQINLLAKQENTEMLKLLRLLCEKSGIRVDSRRQRC